MKEETVKIYRTRSKGKTKSLKFPLKQCYKIVEWDDGRRTIFLTKLVLASSNFESYDETGHVMVKEFKGLRLYRQEFIVDFIDFLESFNVLTRVL